MLAESQRLQKDVSFYYWKKCLYFVQISHFLELRQMSIQQTANNMQLKKEKKILFIFPR